MGGLLQPVHLFFILFIVLILFGPWKLPDLRKGLGREISEFSRRALFMAKGVDPGVGRDVGDMLPDEEAHRSKIWTRLLFAVLLGNTFYFLSSPLLPAAARFNGERISAIPALVDIWFCALVFGILNLVWVLDQRRNSKPKTQNHPPRL